MKSVRRTASFIPKDSGSELELRAEVKVRVPYWQWLIGPLVRRRIRSDLGYMAEVIEARAMSRSEPRPRRRPVWAPPDRLTPEQATSIATLCIFLAIATYGGSLFTQTVDYVATTYRANDADLGVVLALTRAGNLIGLVGSALSDRQGRRRILIVSITGVCTASLLSALAPNLFVFGALQIITRGFTNLVLVVGYIAITEEASEGGRAFMLALAGIAGSAGFAIGALVLPLADVSPEAWRGLFGANLLALFMLPGAARTLSETRRFESLREHRVGPSSTEVTKGLYGRRFAIVAVTGLLISFFAAPVSQFTNRYLAAERGFSGLGILVLRFFTQGPPALVGVWLGGKLAESSGRRATAIPATILSAIATAGFFLTDGALLWATLLIATVAGAVAGPSLAAFNTELFPTDARGRAGAGLLMAAVIGSVAGLLVSGFLSKPLGSVGPAVALTAVAPILVSIFLIPLLPEAKGRELDALSPPR